MFVIKNTLGDNITLESGLLVCANPKCRQPIILISAGTARIGEYNEPIPFFYDVAEREDSFSCQKMPRDKKLFYMRRVWPENKGKVFSNVPQNVWQDYDEACQISTLSPKASATLARRCLQNMIRDYWEVSKNRLGDEIDEIAKRPEVTPEIVDALNALRNLGNIGAHPEKDVNVIVDIEPENAPIILNIIEMLFEEWYEARAKRQQKLQGITALADQKKSKKTQKTTP